MADGKVEHIADNGLELFGLSDRSHLLLPRPVAVILIRRHMY